LRGLLEPKQLAAEALDEELEAGAEMELLLGLVD
jgi:hypothetical protein